MTEDCLIVSFCNPDNGDFAVLVVGRPGFNNDVDILNTYVGQKAVNLHKRLTTAPKANKSYVAYANYLKEEQNGLKNS